MVTRMTFKEYQAEQAERNVSVADKLKRLTGDSKTLNTHPWSDAQLRAIPEELVQYAFEHSLTLQEEFGTFSCFMAYRRADAAGVARVAVVRR